jgi:hypothetical protein
MRIAADEDHQIDFDFAFGLCCGFPSHHHHQRERWHVFSRGFDVAKVGQEGISSTKKLVRALPLLHVILDYHNISLITQGYRRRRL